MDIILVNAVSLGSSGESFQVSLKLKRNGVAEVGEVSDGSPHFEFVTFSRRSALDMLGSGV